MSEEKRVPLLSDEDMYSIVGVDDFGEWRVRPLKSPFEIRDFYESKITSGELMVVKTTKNDELNCEHCDAWLAGDGDFVVDHNFCPDCGARIVKQ